MNEAHIIFNNDSPLHVHVGAGAYSKFKEVVEEQRKYWHWSQGTSLQAQADFKQRNFFHIHVVPFTQGD